MTEKEVLAKLEVFKEAINSLKETINKQKLIIEQSNDYMRKHDEQDKFDTIAQESMQAHIEELEQSLNSLEKEKSFLAEEHERCENAFAELAHRCNELRKECRNKDAQLEEKKYSEEDLKKLLHKASEKSKNKIEELTTSNKVWEEQFYALQAKYENLELANKSLENSLKEKEAQKEIDKVLDHQMTDKEMDEILHKNSRKAQELTKEKKVITLAV